MGTHISMPTQLTVWPKAQRRQGGCSRGAKTQGDNILGALWYSFSPAAEPAEYVHGRDSHHPHPMHTLSLVLALTFTQLLGIWVIANWVKKTNSLFFAPKYLPPFLLGTVTASSPECHTMLKRNRSVIPTGKSWMWGRGKLPFRDSKQSHQLKSCHKNTSPESGGLSCRLSWRVRRISHTYLLFTLPRAWLGSRSGEKDKWEKLW